MWVQVLVVELNDLSSIPRTHVMEGREPVPARCPLTSTWVPSSQYVLLKRLHFGKVELASILELNSGVSGKDSTGDHLGSVGLGWNPQMYVSRKWADRAGSV